MTKFILNSGGLRKNPKKATQFYQETLKGLGNNPRVLFCFFAQKRENWEEKYEEYRKSFVSLIKESIRPTFDLAFPDNFVQQVDRADAIIIYGGDDCLLLHWLSKFNLKMIFKDKVIATSSAGSDALATYFWTCDWRKCMDGLSLVPIKFIPHYKSDFGDSDPRGKIDWDGSYRQLANYGDNDLPIYALEEGNYKVFEI